MKSIRTITPATALFFAGAIAIALFGCPTHAQQAGTKCAESHYVSPTGYITGMVQGEKGPEAGVWVIAETKDFQTPMIKIVVTDDAGPVRAARIAGGEL